MSQSEAAQQAELGVGDVEKHTTFAEVESQDEESGVVVATRNGEPVEPKEKKYMYVVCHCMLSCHGLLHLHRTFQVQRTFANLCMRSRQFNTFSRAGSVVI